MDRRSPSVLFGTVLVSTMGASTFALTCYAVLASDLIAEFGVDRWQIGALVTAMALIGAVISPRVGSIIDGLGAKRSTTLTMVVAAAGLTALAVAPAYWLVVAAALVSGLAQAMANPSTNKLIAFHVESGRRGVITGVKQSGVTFWTFLGGLVLPAVAVAAGWRWAVAVFAAAAAGGAVLSVAIPPDPPDGGGTGVGAGHRIDPYIFRVAVYGLILGAAGSAIYTFMPLYAEESLGFGQGTAALTVAVAGLAGVVGRIAWGRISERWLGTIRSLEVMAVLASASAGILVVATSATWLLWPAAVMSGLSASAWNSVGMLAVMEHTPPAQTGRASGVVLLGFLTGLGFGAPLFGYSIDRLGVYTPGWAVVGLVFLLGVVVMRVRPGVTRSRRLPIG